MGLVVPVVSGFVCVGIGVHTGPCTCPCHIFTLWVEEREDEGGERGEGMEGGKKRVGEWERRINQCSVNRSHPQNGNTQLANYLQTYMYIYTSQKTVDCTVKCYSYLLTYIS